MNNPDRTIRSIAPRRAARALGAAAFIAGVLGTIGLTASAASTQAIDQRGAAAPCAISTLDVWLNTTGNGTAGSIYYVLEFTNLSAHVCTLTGFPGVSAINLGGGQLGKAASRNPQRASRTVRLAPGGTANATLQIVEAGNFSPSACHLTTAAGLRVYAPGATVARTVPFPFSACTLSGPAILTVAAVAAGIGGQ
jgi:hypothetical protein